MAFLIGKGALSGALAAVYVYTSELFPTSVRASAVGTCSTFGQIGAVITPWVSDQVSFVLFLEDWLSQSSFFVRLEQGPVFLRAFRHFKDAKFSSLNGGHKQYCCFHSITEPWALTTVKTFSRLKRNRGSWCSSLAAARWSPGCSTSSCRRPWESTSLKLWPTPGMLVVASFLRTADGKKKTASLRPRWTRANLDFEAPRQFWFFDDFLPLGWTFFSMRRNSFHGRFLRLFLICHLVTFGMSLYP